MDIVMEMARMTQIVIRWQYKKSVIVSAQSVFSIIHLRTTLKIHYLIFIQMQNSEFMDSPPTSDTPPQKSNSNNEQLQRRCLDINNLFNKLTTYAYKPQFSDIHSNLENDLSHFFSELIWAEKKHPQLIYELFEMNALQQINEIHGSSYPLLFFKNYIILITNLRERGVIAGLLLDHHLLKKVLGMFLEAVKGEEEDQIIEYVGSFLKMYQRMFHPDWLSKFIDEDGYFQLLQISFRFYNCSQPITRTSVFNNIFAILSHKEVREYLSKSNRLKYYEFISNELTKQFRQQLAEYCLRLSHTSKNDDVEYIMNELDDKIAFWDDIGKSMQGCQNIFQESFMKNVIVPLLVGPLNYKQHPIFTLKFTLYSLKKIIPILHKLKLISKFIKITFIEETIQYNPNTLHKGILVPFHISTILQKQLPSLEFYEEQQQFQIAEISLKKFYLNIFRSKDNHFIMMSTTLLLTIVHLLRTQNEAQVLSECQLGYHNQKLLYKFSEIMICQLQEQHRLNTLISIVDTLVYLNRNSMQNLLQHQFLYIFRNIIREVEQLIDKYRAYLDGIVQTVEYDINILENVKFGNMNFKKGSEKKIEDNYKVVFTWDLEKQEELQTKFYTSIPDTNEEQARYLFIKFMILRKGYILLFDAANEENSSKSLYHEQTITKSPFMPGDIYQLHQLRAYSIECEMHEQKNKIPILIFKDDYFFVMGHLNKQQKSVRIMTSLKLRHVQIDNFIKKDKLCMRLFVKSFNYENQRMQEKQPIQIRDCPKIIPFLMASQQLSKERQIIFIKKLLNLTKNTLPEEVSLL